MELLFELWLIVLAGRRRTLEHIVSDPLDLAELHIFRLRVLQTQGNIFLVVSIVSSLEIWCVAMPIYHFLLTGPQLHGLYLVNRV